MGWKKGLSLFVTETGLLNSTSNCPQLYGYAWRQISKQFFFKLVQCIYSVVFSFSTLRLH